MIGHYTIWASFVCADIKWSRLPDSNRGHRGSRAVCPQALILLQPRTLPSELSRVMTALITMMFENKNLSIFQNQSQTLITNKHQSKYRHLTMPELTGFAVIGCSKCRRIMSADLSHATKTCQCGHKMELRKTKIIAVFDSADEAARAVMQMQERKNTGFTSAAEYANR